MKRRRIAVIEALLQRQRAPYRRLGIVPLSPIIGAEVEGLDLQFLPDAEAAQELRRAFLEHHVLVFRDQHLSDESQRRVITLLGEKPESGQHQVASHEGGPRGAEPAMLADHWHADETYRAAPPAGTALHIEHLQRLDAGGDMIFANMHLAYELLSEPLRSLLTDLTAVHLRDPAAPPAPHNQAAEHPAVIRHPVTGRPATFVNRRHTAHIVQLEAAQSQATLDMLWRHLETNPVLTCRIRLTHNALVLWDNRSTQHLMLPDFQAGSLQGSAVTIAGAPPNRVEREGAAA